MAGDPVVMDGKVYDDEASMVVATHPDIPNDIKRLYVTPSTPDEKKTDNTTPTTSTMPLGSTEKPAGEFNQVLGTEVAPQQMTSPEPSDRLDMTAKYNTPLTATEQEDYNTKFSPGDSYDYDMQGYYKANPGVEPNTPGTHYPDTYKKPNHPTFSDQSQYHGTDGLQGGTWGNEDGKDTFTPGPTNLQNHGMEKLQEYFKRTEPDVKLNTPEAPRPGPFSGVSFSNMGKALNSGIDAVTGAVSRLPETLQNLPEETLRKAWSAVRAPHDSWAGELVPGSPQEIERAHDLAGLMVMGPAPVASKMADGTLGSFAGVRSARNLNKTNDLGHAQVLEADGVHPDKIFQDSGWFRGPDSRWRHEISDHKAEFKPEWYNKEPKPGKDSAQMLEDEMGSLLKQTPFDRNQGLTQTTLGKVLDHPELYKAYPHLKDVKVVKDPSIQTAVWDEANNEIRVGPPEFNTKDTFLHEIQHAIQGHENFARGAHWGTAGSTYALKHAEEARKQIVEPLQTLYKKLSAKGAVVSQEELTELTRLQMMAKKYNEYAKSGNDLAYQHYMDTAGEVEARNTETRMLMNDKERRAMHPNWTSGVDNPIVNLKSRYTTPYDRKK